MWELHYFVKKARNAHRWINLYFEKYNIFIAWIVSWLGMYGRDADELHAASHSHADEA